MNHMEKMTALRADTAVHYNCCQCTVMPFAAECGIDEETALHLASYFGSGMRHGGTCGAVTGALMVLGMAGKDEHAATSLLAAFREKNKCLECAALLKIAVEAGEERKPHCDRMVRECVELLEERI